MTMYTKQFYAAPRWKRVLMYLVGALALTPLVFMSREIATGNFAHLAISDADVLGSGTFIIFLSMLAITPLITVTGQRWFAPLRWWFGVVFFATAAVDLVIASITTSVDFEGGFLSRTVGHSFLLMGVLATMLSIPLVATANKFSQRRLGHYWKWVQRITYVVWFLIGVHLLLLFGAPSLRFQQFMFASFPLVVLRLPWVRNWWIRERGAYGWRAWTLWVVGLVLAAMFLWGYGHLIGELINRGVNAISGGVADT